jgi:hypothetical protein
MKKASIALVLLIGIIVVAAIPLGITNIKASQETHTWAFCSSGFFPKHLSDSFYGSVQLGNLADVPSEVQGVYWYDCATLQWKFWAPGAPGCTLTTGGGGHTYDYMVAVTGVCMWEVPLSSGTPTPTTTPAPKPEVYILWSEIITELDDAVPGLSMALETITQQDLEIIITGTATEDNYIYNFATNLEEKEHFWDVRVMSIVSSGGESSFNISSQLNGISLEQYIAGRIIPSQINTLELVDYIIDVLQKAGIDTYSYTPGGTGTVIIGGAIYHTPSYSISITSAELLTTLINLQSYIEEPPIYGTLNNVGVIVDNVNLSYLGSEQWNMDFRVGVITE